MAMDVTQAMRLDSREKHITGGLENLGVIIIRMIYLVMYIVLFIGLVAYLRGAEYFAEYFVEADGAEFRGINLLGVNSVDTAIPCRDRDACRDICGRNRDCAGYSYYKPGQRCYIFQSGGFVNGRPGYFSGKKAV